MASASVCRGNSKARAKRWAIGLALSGFILAAGVGLNTAIGQQGVPPGAASQPPAQPSPASRPAAQQAPAAPRSSPAPRQAQPASPSQAPAVTSGPQVPAATQAPSPAPVAAPAGAAGHVLAGVWRVQWPLRSVVNALTVDNVVAFQGGVNLSGSYVGDGNERCLMSGTVFDQFGAPVRDGLDTRVIAVSALVRLRLQCPNADTWIEAFGMPSGPILMAGRGTRLAANSQPAYEPVVLGRP